MLFFNWFKRKDPAPQSADAVRTRLRDKAERGSNDSPDEPQVTIVGLGTTITGPVEAGGPIEIFGIVKGGVRSPSIIIQPGGRLEGDVVCRNITIMGTVDGNVSAQTAHLKSGGVVNGDMGYEALNMEPGAVFNGASRHRAGQRPGSPRPALPGPNAATSPQQQGYDYGQGHGQPPADPRSTVDTSGYEPHTTSPARQQHTRQGMSPVDAIAGDEATYGQHVAHAARQGSRRSGSVQGSRD